MSYLDEHREELTESSMEEILSFVDSDVNDIAVKRFCLQAAQCVEKGELQALEDLLVAREKATKGRTRAKLTNWKKYVGLPHAGAFFLDYRWSLVYKMINEIKRGLEYGN